VVFPLWDLIRNDLPLPRGSFHLIQCLLCKSLHYMITPISVWLRERKETGDSRWFDGVE
jgi:hypothetical protein